MSFFNEIVTVYNALGPAHILPFVGDAYREPDRTDFRIAVVGINSYISQKDWPRIQPEWFQGWWKNAACGHGRRSTYRYYTTAFKEADQVALLVSRGRDWRGLRYESAVEIKRDFYGTNAIKVYTTEKHKSSASLSQSYIDGFSQCWRAELDLMAQYGCLPHLVVVLGQAIWNSHLNSFSTPADSLRYRHFSVRECCRARSCDAHRIRLDSAHGEHALLLVRLHHPTAFQPRKGAAWLTSQTDFLELTGIDTLEGN